MSKSFSGLRQSGYPYSAPGMKSWMREKDWEALGETYEEWRTSLLEGLSSEVRACNSQGSAGGMITRLQSCETHPGGEWLADRIGLNLSPSPLHPVWSREYR